MGFYTDKFDYNCPPLGSNWTNPNGGWGNYVPIWGAYYPWQPNSYDAVFLQTQTSGSVIGPILSLWNQPVPLPNYTISANLTSQMPEPSYTEQYLTNWLGNYGGGGTLLMSQPCSKSGLAFGATALTGSGYYYFEVAGTCNLYSWNYQAGYLQGTTYAQSGSVTYTLYKVDAGGGQTTLWTKTWNTASGGSGGAYSIYVSPPTITISYWDPTLGVNTQAVITDSDFLGGGVGGTYAGICGYSEVLPSTWPSQFTTYFPLGDQYAYDVAMEAAISNWTASWLYPIVKKGVRPVIASMSGSPIISKPASLHTFNGQAVASLAANISGPAYTAVSIALNSTFVTGGYIVVEDGEGNLLLGTIASQSTTGGATALGLSSITTSGTPANIAPGTPVLFVPAAGPLWYESITGILRQIAAGDTVTDLGDGVGCIGTVPSWLSQNGFGNFSFGAPVGF